MSVLVSWVNPNTNSTLVLYRSFSPIDKQNLPAPLATFTAGEQSYTDTGVTFGQKPYYLLHVTAGTESGFSREVMTTVTVDTGPGPNELQWGDNYLGYFGMLYDFELGFSLGQWYNSAPDSRYFKIFYQGRILFVGVPVINTGKNAAALIAAKIFNTGVTSRFGADPDAGGAIVTIGGRKFAPRIAKLYDYANTLVDPISYSINYADGMPYGQSEFLDLYRMTVRAVARTAMSPFRFAHNTFGSTVPTICSDYAAAARTTVAGFATAPAPATLGLGITSVATNSANNSFIPVLEYIRS